MVKTSEQHADGRIEFAQQEQLAVAQGREDPALGHLHTNLDLDFVLGFTRYAGNTAKP